MSWNKICRLIQFNAQAAYNYGNNYYEKVCILGISLYQPIKIQGKYPKFSNQRNMHKKLLISVFKSEAFL